MGRDRCTHIVVEICRRWSVQFRCCRVVLDRLESKSGRDIFDMQRSCLSWWMLGACRSSLWGRILWIYDASFYR